MMRNKEECCSRVMKLDGKSKVYSALVDCYDRFTWSSDLGYLGFRI